MKLLEIVKSKTTIMILGVLFFALSMAFFVDLYLDEDTISVIKIESIWWYALGCVTAFFIRWMYRNHVGTRSVDLWYLFKTKEFLLVAGVGIATGFAVLFFSHWLINRQIMLGDILTENPPIVFSLVLGYLTFLGIYANYVTLHEQKTIITSFPQLIKRLILLIENAKGTVHIFAYTPAIGYLALEKSYWKNLRQAIENKVGVNEVGPFKMICLPETELAKWHLAFKGRKTPRGKPSNGYALTEDHCNQATKAASDIITEICESSVTSEEVVKRHPFDKMPSYYVFFSEDRAISISPLALPVADGKGGFSLDRVPITVQMLGFETIDPRIISDIQSHFERYWSM